MVLFLPILFLSPMFDLFSEFAQWPGLYHYPPLPQILFELLVIQHLVVSAVHFFDLLVVIIVLCDF